MSTRLVPEHRAHAIEVLLDAEVLGHLWRDGKHWIWATTHELDAAPLVPLPVLESRREDTSEVAAYRLLKAVTDADWRSIRDALATRAHTEAA